MKRLFLFFLMLSGLASCTLTTDEVEPALPGGPVLDTNTVAYQLNGLPVVAHNYGSLISAIFSFGSRLQAVEGYLQADGTLQISAVDDQNYVGPASVEHALGWELRNFRGVGRYQPDLNTATLQLNTRDAANKEWVQGPTQLLELQSNPEVMITAWDPTTQHLSGTFTLQFGARGSAQPATLHDGRFDLTLSY